MRNCFWLAAFALLLTSCASFADMGCTLEVGPSAFDKQCIDGRGVRDIEFCDCTNPDADPQVLEICEGDYL